MIRHARPEETQAIWCLVKEHAEYERMLDAFEGTVEDLRRHLFGLRPVGKCLVAEEEGEVVGYALFYANYSTFLTRPGLWLEDLYVSPRSRGRGYGRRLLEGVARAALDEGCIRVDWVVAGWNEGAIRFYESLGAERLVQWQICRVSGEALEQVAGTMAARV